ncbi:hypothetical protein [Parapedobacter defluvii]|uniref:hypothetical protein n=1 Tax=Parapedobacter defluvii TaxID=2045106 RepID=UPI0033425C38
MEEKKQPLSLVERLKRQAEAQQREPMIMEHAQTHVMACPNCGAGRAKQDGITHCAYCGHAFTSHRLTEGIHVKPTDNSK